MDFMTFVVSELFGSMFLAMIGMGFLFYVIAVLGKMGYMLILALMSLYLMTFGVAFFGMLFWLPVLLLATLYFFIQVYNYIQRST